MILVLTSHYIVHMGDIYTTQCWKTRTQYLLMKKKVRTPIVGHIGIEAAIKKMMNILVKDWESVKMTKKLWIIRSKNYTSLDAFNERTTP